MAVKKVIILLGQSNMEGYADKASLPVALRGPQALRYIFNYENNAREILDCDGVGANLPNNTTFHTTGKCGPELSLAEVALAEFGEVDIFKFAVPGAAMGPSIFYDEWNIESSNLSAQFLVRWNAYIALMAGLGHTVDVVLIAWFQGESDAEISGNDLAYFGLYRRFIASLRTYLAPASSSLSIRWIANLIHRIQLPVPGFSFLLNGTENVRAALMRAGWDDPEYRIVDADNFSYNPLDPIHLDTNGVVACGYAIWNAYKLTYNNTMALEDYTLSSLRSRLAEEFGIDATIQANKNTIDKRINDAIAWVVNRRKNWPWLERDVSIDVGERSTLVADNRYGAAVFYRAQAQALSAIFSLDAIRAREIIDFDGSGHTGLVVSSYAGTTITLRHGYRGDDQECAVTAITTGATTVFTINTATSQGGTAVIPTNVGQFPVAIVGSAYTVPPAGTFDGVRLATRVSANQFAIAINSTGWTINTLGTVRIAREFRIAQSYFELPEDFIRSLTLHTDSDPDENTISYNHPTLFEREVRANRLQTTLDRIYTVVVDPLNLSSRKYLAVYPYFLERSLLHLKYYGDAKKLISDEDVPDVPRSDRFVVWYAAAWFVAQWQKDTDMVSFYRDGALNELERMTKEYQLSDDITESLPEFSEPTGPVRGPDGFPEFELS